MSFVLANRRHDPNQNFANFVVGASNRLAVTAAESIAKNDASHPCPLFIHGGSGYGKTHLLNAIVLKACVTHRTRVLFLRAEDFTRRFLSPPRQAEEERLAFMAELGCVDLLLFDDLQHLSGNTTLCNIFLRAVRILSGWGRRVVIAADQPLSRLQGLGEELCVELRRGVAVELQCLDAKMRLALLKAKATALERMLPGVSIPDHVLNHIAESLDNSPREFLGVLVKLATYADLSKKPVSAKTVEAMICHCKENAHRVTLDDIMKKIAGHYQLELRELYSARRAMRVARPRQVVMYLSRELTTCSLPDIGRRLGDRDHTTVLHGCRRIEALCKSDLVLRQEVDFLRHVLTRRSEPVARA